MSIISKFIFSALFSGFAVSVVSVAWPKISGMPRPQLLSQVYQTVKPTIIGKQTAQVLGIQDDKSEPIDTNKLLGNMKDWAGQKIQDRVTQIAAKQAVIQISQGFDKLNPVEKSVLREAICQPAK